MKGIELASSSPEQLGAFIAGEIERWRPIIRKLGLKAE